MTKKSAKNDGIIRVVRNKGNSTKLAIPTPRYHGSSKGNAQNTRPFRIKAIQHVVLMRRTNMDATRSGWVRS